MDEFEVIEVEDEEVVYLNIFGLPTNKEHAVFKKVYKKSGLIVMYAVHKDEK